MIFLIMGWTLIDGLKGIIVHQLIILITVQTFLVGSETRLPSRREEVGFLRVLVASNTHADVEDRSMRH
jgi:hypothetical protein